MDSSFSQQNPSPEPDASVTQSQVSPSEFSENTLVSSKKSPDKKIIQILLVVFLILILIVVGVYFTIQIVNKKETAQITTVNPTTAPDKKNNSDLNKYDGKFNFFYPKSWSIQQGQASDEELETVVLTNYSISEEDNTSASGISTFDGAHKLNFRLEFQYFEIPTLADLPGGLNENLDSQGTDYVDLNIANFRTIKIYGSNQEGEFFEAYTARPDIEKTLTVFVYYQGLIPSEITQSQMDSIQSTTEWGELKEIFSSISFD